MFNQYPYLNLNDLNLDYILKAIKEMRYEVTNFVSINAIKYADPIQWNITRQYEKNTIVIDPVTGTAYISVAPVPAGVALTREEFWTVVFDLGSFVTRAAQNFTSRWESETTLTATFSTPAGAWLVWGDILYKALVNITAGDTYVVGSNIEHFTMEDVYHSILTAISNEATARINADNALGGRIDTEITDRTNADNALGGRIDTEITDRTNADNALGGRIVTEITDRTNADNALGGRIDTEITDRTNADNALSARITSNNENFTPKVDNATSNATFTSDQGNFLIVNGELMQALTNIAIGDPYAIGTNISRMHVSNMYSFLSGLIGTNTDGISALNSDVARIIGASPLAGDSEYVIVSKHGGQYTKINDAIAAVRDYVSETNRVAIIIMSGVYTENITLFPNYGIDLIGVGDVTIQSDVEYPNAPLYVSGNIYVENIKFLAFTSDHPTYGLHIESAATNCYLKFVNCQFTSVDTSGAGIGMSNLMEVTFINCKFISWKKNALYAHNFPNTASGQKLKLYGCEFESFDANSADAVIEDATYRMGNAGAVSTMDVSFPHCVFKKGLVSYVEVTNGAVTRNLPYLPASGNVTLSSTSRNTLYSVDIDKYTPTIRTTSYADGIGSTYIPYKDANRFTWHIDEVLSQGGANITASASIFSTDQYGIRVLIPAATSANENNIYKLSAVPV